MKIPTPLNRGSLHLQNYIYPVPESHPYSRLLPGVYYKVVHDKLDCNLRQKIMMISFVYLFPFSYIIYLKSKETKKKKNFYPFPTIIGRRSIAFKHSRCKRYRSISDSISFVSRSKY